MSPYIHSAVLTGLEPRKDYVYKPAGAPLREFNFQMFPKKGDANQLQPFKISVWAEFGVTDISLSVMLSLKDQAPELTQSWHILSMLMATATFGTVSVVSWSRCCPPSPCLECRVTMRWRLA
ncbi:unnamed protein product [Polarella glacialis]|uniref:Uncharacterized protein n=1 Tax=Polarella glacialis TaxID=89957 RepID=A0A813HQG2_POLGL|nr:unnamed protein product [Polarella glacialis]CAE8662092.1 unnamed protein product [Polarella glacialis]